MKVLAIILLLANVAIISSVGDSNETDFQHQLDITLEKNWVEFKTKFNKVFATTEEDRARKIIYQNNIIAISRHNILYKSKLSKFTMEINTFGDLKRDEFVAKVNGFKKQLVTNVKNYPDGDASAFSMSNKVNIPKSIDWRQKGYVTPVKTQGPCGSCWSFSATGSLEGQHFRKTGKLVSFSEQNLIDCSRMYGNYGCEGGLMNLAFKYIKSNKGLEADKSYPYEAKNNRCHYTHQNAVTRDIGFVTIPEGDEYALKKAVGTVGPVSVAIDASSTKFQFYQDGIYENSECNSTALDHGVLVVGYDTDSNKGDYWIVKNSWGTQWGKQGYILMARNKNNHCGIASSASYPVVV